MLKGESEDEDIAEIGRYCRRLTAELAVSRASLKHNSTPQNEEKTTHFCNLSEEEEKLASLKTLQFGSCSEHIFKEQCD